MSSTQVQSDQPYYLLLFDQNTVGLRFQWSPLYLPWNISYMWISDGKHPERLATPQEGHKMSNDAIRQCHGLNTQAPN